MTSWATAFHRLLPAQSRKQPKAGTTFAERNSTFAPGRHIAAFRKKAGTKGEALPISINVGVDPAACMGTSFEARTTPLGFGEPTVGGGLRGEGVNLVDCLMASQESLARAVIGAERRRLHSYARPKRRMPSVSW